MKPVSLLVSVLIAIQPVYNFAALASSVKYSPGAKAGQASIEAQVKTSNIGALTFDKGKVVLSNNRLDVIFESADLTTKNPVLTGTTFNTHVVGEHRNSRITGLVYLDGGSAINQVSTPEITDKIWLNDGTTYTGQISTVTNDKIEIVTGSGTQSVVPENIKDIHSSRIFKFNLPVNANTDIDSRTSFQGDASQISFVSTVGAQMVAETSVRDENPAPKSSTSQDSNKAKRIAVAVIVIALVATAIAVPVAVGVATHHHHHNNSNNQIAFFNLLRSRTAAPAPVVAP